MPVRIETNRLLLRKFQDTDTGDILEYSSEADFMLARNLPWKPMGEEIAAYYRKCHEADPESLPDWFNLVIEIKDESRVVGDVHMYLTNKVERQAAIGFLLSCPYQGRGIATEAVKALIAFGFESMGLHRIVGRTGHFNAPSWRLMERVGMRREAHFRKSHQVEGQWDDELIYAVLAEEWGEERTPGS